jgi:putative ABC transport system ATP-binding protein
MIRTVNLTFTYVSGPSFRFPDIDLSEGEIGLLRGPSGSGKTTFLQILAGQRIPSSGTMAVPSRLGFILQRPRLIPSLKVIENLMLVPMADGYHVRQMASSLGMDSVLHRKPDSLSEGERQRATIIRAFANHPRVVLADEPTSALDDMNTQSWMTLMRELCRETKSVVLIATHDPRLSDMVESHKHYRMA